ncbi:MAG: hypothetical protein JO016_18170 [Actinobacteria bacterium]|nr:hypothetical protein [Actinomycetota bacterium]
MSPGGDGEVAGRDEPRPVLARWRLGLINGSLLALTGGVLFSCYLRQSWTRSLNSDGAADILQAHDLLQGNVLLHGWQLSQVSFWSTELPQYMLLESVLGVRAAVVHVAGAMTCTLLVLLSALLAKGRTTGREAVVRMLVAGGIMLAPQLGPGTAIFMLSPDHAGTAVPLLVTWLVVDRLAGRRWWTPVIVVVLLAWALVADPLVLWAGVLPLAVAGAARAGHQLAVERRPLAAARPDLALAAAAMLAVPAASAAYRLIRAHGGYGLLPLADQTIPADALLRSLTGTLEDVLALFGADFLGLTTPTATALAAVHLAGLGLAVWGVAVAVRRFPRDRDRVVQILLIAVLAMVTAMVISGRATSLHPTDGRVMAPMLASAAALTGRVLAARLFSARLLSVRLLPLLGAALLGYVAALGYGAAQPPAPAVNQQLATWLVAHHFGYGLSGYWQGSSVTVISGQRAQLRPIQPAPSGAGLGPTIEAQASWYDPRQHDAGFVIVPAGLTDNVPPDPTLPEALATFGKPRRTYRVGTNLVLVYDRNLLPSVHRLKSYGYSG